MLRRSFFPAGVLLAALTALRPAAAAETGAAQKLTADDYIEIQQLYAAYAHALDKGEGERFASTFVLDGEFTGGRGPGRGGEARNPIKGKDAFEAVTANGGGSARDRVRREDRVAERERQRERGLICVHTWATW